VSEAAPGAQVRRLAVAIPTGIATGLLTRLALFVITRPHSVLSRLPTWQALAGTAVGLVVSAVLLRPLGAVGAPKIVWASLFLLTVLVLHWALFDLRLAQRLVPDLWSK
jgi:hypothetical protein